MRFDLDHTRTEIPAELNEATQRTREANGSMSLSDLPFSLILLLVLILVSLGSAVGNRLQRSHQTRRLIVHLRNVLTLEQLLSLEQQKRNPQTHRLMTHLQNIVALERLLNLEPRKRN